MGASRGFPPCLAFNEKSTECGETSDKKPTDKTTLNRTQGGPSQTVAAARGAPAGLRQKTRIRRMGQTPDGGLVSLEGTDSAGDRNFNLENSTKYPDWSRKRKSKNHRE